MKVLFIPHVIESQWDAIEVSQVYENKEMKFFERIDSEEMLRSVVSEGHAVFWSVYIHLVDGGTSCIADFQDQIMAESFSSLLKNAVLNFKDNGHL